VGSTVGVAASGLHRCRDTKAGVLRLTCELGVVDAVAAAASKDLGEEVHLGQHVCIHVIHTATTSVLLVMINTEGRPVPLEASTRPTAVGGLAAGSALDEAGERRGERLDGAGDGRGGGDEGRGASACSNGARHLHTQHWRAGGGGARGQPRLLFSFRHM
jgi:hypothetical protein